MTRSIPTLAAVALASLITFGTGVSMADPKTPPIPNGAPKTHNKTTINGAKTTNIRTLRRWRSYCWYPPYRCYLFNDSATRQWYFWNDRRNQFLPLSMIRLYPPTTNGVALLPPGAVDLGNSNSAPPLPDGAVPDQGNNSIRGGNRNQGGANDNQGAANNNRRGGNRNQGGANDNQGDNGNNNQGSGNGNRRGGGNRQGGGGNGNDNQGSGNGNGRNRDNPPDNDPPITNDP